MKQQCPWYKSCISTQHNVIVNEAAMPTTKNAATTPHTITRQMLAASWGKPEVQQLNNAPIDGLYSTNCIALCSKQNFSVR